MKTMKTRLRSKVFSLGQILNKPKEKEKKFRSKKVLPRKKSSPKANLGSQKNLGPKNVLENKFWCKKVWVKNILGEKIFWDLRNFGSKENYGYKKVFGSKKSLDLKKFWAQKILSPKNKFVSEKFCVWKNFRVHIKSPKRLWNVMQYL